MFLNKDVGVTRRGLGGGKLGVGVGSEDLAQAVPTLKIPAAATACATRLLATPFTKSMIGFSFGIFPQLPHSLPHFPFLSSVEACGDGPEKPCGDGPEKD